MVSLVVMGVSGCGKSRVAAELAGVLGLPLIEGDEFHSAHALALMRQGVPLTDADRAGWLDRLAARLGEQQAEGAVLTCSALKASYRERLRAGSPGLRFVWLDLDAREAMTRVAQRADHFFPPELVATQFEALEPPLAEAGVLRVDAREPPAEIVARVAQWLAAPT